MELISCHKMFDGEHRRYRHVFKAVQSEMTFAVYLPKQALKGACLPVLYYLSGLTCNDENFSTKSGAQQYAAKYGIILVIPDTSPRGETVPDDEAYDLGQGAGFYVNATASPWSVHYQMYDYIVDELPRLIEKNFNVGQKAICGHSMGGHGALQIGLKTLMLMPVFLLLLPLLIRLRRLGVKKHLQRIWVKKSLIGVSMTALIW